MSYQEISSLDADIVVALGKKDKKTGKAYPKQAEGYYLGKRSVESSRGSSFLHFLQTSEGNLGVWGTTDLNRKLSQVPAGTMVRITSTGTKPTPNGPMYTYKVEQDSSNTIEVSSQDDSTGDNDNEDNYQEDENDLEHQVPSRADVETLLRVRKSAKN
jgi:hypothetical protein